MKRWWKLATGGLIAALLGVLYYLALPSPLFRDPYSTVLEDRQGQLLSASIASDGQWRFPLLTKVPAKYKEAVVLFEDRRFENHVGVDPLSLGRAILQNINAGKVVSGGSTISMQVIRLSRKGRARTVFEKCIEVILATRLELSYSKDEILSLYASHAPFGGNVVGIEAACWRYFGRSPEDLTWSDAALLAILPNNPALVHPGKNREILKSKRDHLLDRLYAIGKLDNVSIELAKAEPIPDQPQPLPTLARHLLQRMASDGFRQQKIVSTLDAALQQRAEQIIADHLERLKGNQIFNAAAIVADVKTGQVLAYVGNTQAGDTYQDDVDVIRARRSTGSILKPFLFAAMIDDGAITQKSLLDDIPTNIQGFAPRNFSHQFDGAVPADKALIRSLNIPFVNALRQYRYEKFHDLLKQLGLTTLDFSADHYGLSLILGGAEGSLWDITGAYASMARVLENYFERPGKNRYASQDVHPLVYMAQPGEPVSKGTEETSVLSASSIWLTFQALKEVYRPGEETGWRFFESSKTIAWKTGTSFGFRDAWAIGVNPEFAVGVWTGNADGEGRPGLLGTEAAAPVMFDLFSTLPGHSWFSQPKSEMQRVGICSKSGQRATSVCDAVDTLWIAKSSLNSAACQYHKLVHLSLDGSHRVHSECARVGDIRQASWFILPPVQEYYYRIRNLSYRSLPPYGANCADPSSVASMDLIYPRQNARIYIPRELDGQLGSAVFEAAHRTNSATVYWHLDGNFIGATKKSHHVALAPGEGKHVLTLVDEFGERLERSFAVISSQ